MPADSPVLIVGGTVRALITDRQLHLPERRHSVQDLPPPERGVGGGFASLRRDGYRLDLGLRLLELGYDDPSDAAP